MDSHDLTLPLGYTIHHGYPSVPQYLHLRLSSGLSPKTSSQAAAVSTGSWYGCYVTFDGVNGDPQPIGMGRVIGDGGWYFHIADMAIHPEHQKKGLGDVILKTLLREIRNRAPTDGKPYISLLADKAGRRLYLKNGFVESAPEEMGMVLEL
ncbi:Acyl-CoA N-acyltransferase [Penicillium frequentans]|uniref:Acyl-CoA N-acyltransferase n=1 Tax=Penicillium frequentans TaxID=3151616 RepID=A0AAD6GCE9_9EURO|nr:Acyl-CoA N-acyltransferase [Penicillium glabrum]